MNNNIDLLEAYNSGLECVLGFFFLEEGKGQLFLRKGLFSLISCSDENYCINGAIAAMAFIPCRHLVFFFDSNQCSKT